MYEKFEKQIDTILEKYKGNKLLNVNLKDLKTVEKLMREVGRKASIVESILNALDGEMLDRRIFRENAEEQLEEVEDAKKSLKGDEEELKLHKSRLEKAKGEVKDARDWVKENQDKYKKLDKKAKDQEKIVKARQKQYISESKSLGQDVKVLKKAYADLQKAGKALGVSKIPVENYQDYLSDGEEWGSGKLPSGFSD